MLRCHLPASQLMMDGYLFSVRSLRVQISLCLQGSNRHNVMVFAGLQPAPCPLLVESLRGSRFFCSCLIESFFSACSSRKPTEECHHAGTQPHGHFASSNADGCSAWSRFASVLHCYVNCSRSVCCWFFLDLGSRLALLSNKLLVPGLDSSHLHLYGRFSHRWPDPTSMACS